MCKPPRLMPKSAGELASAQNRSSPSATEAGEHLLSVQAALDELLPEAASCVVPIPCQESAYPEELVCVAHADTRRQQAFTAGRVAARRALTALGITQFPVLRGGWGEPIWPPAVVGSISHSDQLGIASVAYADSLYSLGLDLQIQRTLKVGIERVICTGAEHSLHWHTDKNAALLILFSVKESAYKALHPLLRRHIGFKDIRVDFCADGQFSAAHSASGAVVAGRYADKLGWIVSGCTIAR